MTPPDISGSLLIATLLGYALLIAAYVSGGRLRRQGGAEEWRTGTGEAMPEPLQWHVLTGFAAGGIIILASLVLISNTAEIGLTVPALAAVVLIVLSGAVRTFLGGSGRLHKVAVVIGLPVFLAALALLLIR